MSTMAGDLVKMFLVSSKYMVTGSQLPLWNMRERERAKDPELPLMLIYYITTSLKILEKLETLFSFSEEHSDFLRIPKRVKQTWTQFMAFFLWNSA